ncbi:MAG: hypothetical protein RQ743_09600 [Bacteroidales bacterium]|nr:hypothetical protein [Bacteroidales bacterium]
MKKILIVAIFLLTILGDTFAQRPWNQPVHWIGVNKPIYNWIGFTGSVSATKLVRFGGKVDDGIVFYQEIGFLLGIKYSRVLNEKYAIETGLDFSRNSYNYSYINAFGLREYSVDPENVDLFTIPVGLRVNFRDFSVLAGIQYDRSVSSFNSPIIDKQEGLGIHLRVGKDFYIADRITLFVAPVLIIHNVVPFYPEDNQQRMTELGLRVDFKYGFS